MRCGTLGALLPPSACLASQGRVNAGEQLGLHRGLMSPLPKGTSLVPLPSIPPTAALGPTLKASGHPQPPPSFAAPPRPSPHPSANPGCPRSPRQSGGTCPGTPTVWGRRGAGARSPASRGKRSPAERRLLLSKPNFLAGLRESRGLPPPLPSRGERSEPISLNWFNLFSGADVKYFVIGDKFTFSEVRNQMQRLQVADNEIN